MAGYDNTNRGVLFKNDRKAAANHPDYKGSVDVDGVGYWASGWIKVSGPTSRTPGAKFLSVALERKDGGFSQQNPPSAPEKSRPVFDDMDDDIPF